VRAGAVWVFSMGKLVVTSWLVNVAVTSGLSAIMYWLAMSVWSSGSQTSLTKKVTSFCRYIHLMSEFYFGLNSISGSTFIFRPPCARDRVTMAEAVLHQDRSQRVSDRFPGALGPNPTRRADRCDRRYEARRREDRCPVTVSSARNADDDGVQQTFSNRLVRFGSVRV